MSEMSLLKWAAALLILLKWAAVLLLDVGLTTQLFLMTNHLNDQFVNRLTHAVDRRNWAWLRNEPGNQGHYEPYPFIGPGECLEYFGVFFSYAMPSVVLFSLTVVADKRIWKTYFWLYATITFCAYMILFIPYTVTQYRDTFSTVMDIAFSVIAVIISLILLWCWLLKTFEKEINEIEEFAEKNRIQRMAQLNVDVKSAEVEIRSAVTYKQLSQELSQELPQDSSQESALPLSLP